MGICWQCNFFHLSGKSDGVISDPTSAIQIRTSDSCTSAGNILTASVTTGNLEYPDIGAGRVIELSQKNVMRFARTMSGNKITIASVSSRSKPYIYDVGENITHPF